MAEYLIYIATIGDNSQSFEMQYEEEHIWLTRKMLAALYDAETTIRNFRIVQTEGVRQVNREVEHYNLQMIISVGFKVNNERAIQFRKWANHIVKDFTIKGFAILDIALRHMLVIMHDWETRLNRFSYTR